MNFIRDVILLEQKKILYDLVILSVDRQLFGIGTLTMKIRYFSVTAGFAASSYISIYLLLFASE